MEKYKKFKISKNIYDAEEFIKVGKPTIIKTETLYGILADALNVSAVRNVYKIKGRNPKKPFIILIPHVEMLEDFGIKPTDIEKKLLNYRGLSVILNSPDESLSYLHRGTKTLAFRIPNKDNLINLMENLGLPLIAPSSNPEGLPPSKNIKEAIKYFGDKIPLYVDEGEVKTDKPSTIVKVDKDKIKFIRVGNISQKDIYDYLLDNKK